MSANDFDILERKRLATQYKNAFGNKLFSFSAETLKSRRNFLAASIVPVAFWLFGLEIQAASFLGLTIRGLTNTKLMLVVLGIGFYEGCIFYSRGYQDFCQWRENNTTTTKNTFSSGSYKSSIVFDVQRFILQGAFNDSEKLSNNIEKYTCIRWYSLFINKWHTFIFEIAIPTLCFFAAIATVLF